MSLNLSIKRFRETVEKIEDPAAKIKMQIGYLLAARNSEILTETSPWDLLHNASKPYGLFMKYSFQDFQLTPADLEGIRLGLKEPIKEKVFVITVAVAKRGKKITKKKRESSSLEVSPIEVEKALTKYAQRDLLEKYRKGELKIDPLLIKVLLGEITVKSVALPTDAKFEPWTLSLLTHLKENGKLSFPITRQWFWKNYRQALKDLLPKKSMHSIKNPLRHFRISHLINYYSFMPYEISAYSGWSIQGTFANLGMTASSNIDAYSHLMWRSYFPKLLQPIAQMK